MSARRRYVVRDRAKSEAQGLGRGYSVLNPRYQIIDSTTRRVVDEATTARSARDAAAMLNAGAAVRSLPAIIVDACDECGEKHEAGYSHEGRFGEGPIFAVYCDAPSGQYAGDYYTSERVLLTGTCAWYALCENDATTLVRHPVLGLVPTCERCVEKHAMHDRRVDVGRVGA